MAESMSPWSALSGQLARASRAKGRRELGMSVAEGWRLLERALAAGVLPAGVLIGEDAGQREGSDEARVLRKLREAGIPCIRAPRTVLVTHTAGRSFGDLVGLVPMDDPGLPAFLQQTAPAQPERAQSLLVGLHVLDPGNIGALTRTAYALGAGGALWLGGTDPRHPKALRASMGSCFRLPWSHTNLPPLDVVAMLAEAGWTNYATVATGGTPLPARVSGRSAVWMGGEAHGLPSDVTAACDARVRIPMVAVVDSLSINAAAAVVLSRTYDG